MINQEQLEPVIHLLPNITDVESLRDVMSSIIGEKVEDKELFWFVSIQKADEYSGATLKEMAHLWYDGVEAISTLDDVKNHLEVHFMDSLDEDNNINPDSEEYQLALLVLYLQFDDFYGTEKLTKYIESFQR